MNNFERNPSILLDLRAKCLNDGIPLEIYTRDKKLIVAKGFEDGKIVYAVMRNLVNIYDNCGVMFFDEVESSFDLSTSKLVYGDKRVVDNTGGVYDLQYSNRSGLNMFLLVPEWADQVYAFDAITGDLVDPTFIPVTNPQLQSPKHALQRPWDGKVVVADQVSDVVQLFDTTGAYVNVFAPAGGVNTTILNNVRGAAFRPNKNLLVSSADGGNKIQEFDTSGNLVTTFITASLNSPFAVLERTSDVLITNSSGTADVTRYDLTGAPLGTFITSSLSFAQQIIKLSNGNIATCFFSGTTTSGLLITDSTGANIINTFQTVTGLRGAWQLPNGNFMVTNAAGVHEMNGTTGALIRTVAAAANFQYFGLYNSDILVGINPVQTSNIADGYKLGNNYPNPFNPETNIEFKIAETGQVQLKVYDATGREVANLVNQKMNPGSYNVKFNASNLNSGIYFYTLTANNFRETKKMILVK
ncbi:MAG TPA: T9SS type A sorting domain-containing protein [Ignavibacteria bacterium]|nr:T9SS type A sorting domain-containing protein [Ignavibacteria bacterium]